MRYDCYDSGLVGLKPKRPTKCKICGNESLSNDFGINGLWCGYWRVRKLWFCRNHNPTELENWLHTHVKHDHNGKVDGSTIEEIVTLYKNQMVVNQ